MIGCRTELIPHIWDFHGSNAGPNYILIGVLELIHEICRRISQNRPKATVHIHNPFPQIIGADNIIRIVNFIPPSIQHSLKKTL